MHLEAMMFGRYYIPKQIDDVGIRPSMVEPTSPNNIISPSQNNLYPLGSNFQNNTPQNLAQSNTLLPPKSDSEWREELKRKRKKFGWW